MLGRDRLALLVERDEFGADARNFAVVGCRCKGLPRIVDALLQRIFLKVKQIVTPLPLDLFLVETLGRALGG